MRSLEAARRRKRMWAAGLTLAASLTAVIAWRALTDGSGPRFAVVGGVASIERNDTLGARAADGATATARRSDTLRLRVPLEGHAAAPAWALVLGDGVPPRILRSAIPRTGMDSVASGGTWSEPFAGAGSSRDAAIDVTVDAKGVTLVMPMRHVPSEVTTLKGWLIGSSAPLGDAALGELAAGRTPSDLPSLDETTAVVAPFTVQLEPE